MTINLRVVTIVFRTGFIFFLHVVYGGWMTSSQNPGWSLICDLATPEGA